MQRSLTEVQVLKKLNIDDFRHLTKDKVISMATMLDKMDPEVAKKAIEQFPDFSSTMRQILLEYKQSLDEGMKQNYEGVKSYYQTCDEIISTCQKLLEKDELSFENRSYILGQMVNIAKMKSDKNTEDKKFIVTMSALGLVGLGFAVIALSSVLGSNFKVDTDAVKKLTK